jgi:hypothetical protein
MKAKIDNPIGDLNKDQIVSVLAIVRTARKQTGIGFRAIVSDGNTNYDLDHNFTIIKPRQLNIKNK